MTKPIVTRSVGSGLYRKVTIDCDHIDSYHHETVYEKVESTPPQWICTTLLVPHCNENTTWPAVMLDEDHHTECGWCIIIRAEDPTEENNNE